MTVDVFLSRKSQDSHLARQLMTYLTSRGLSVFDADDLPRHGSSDYRKAIDQALDVTTHLIVVASAAAHITASWIEYEWGFFFNEKRAGRKTGNLLTVLDGTVALKDLPPGLRYYEVIPFAPENFDRIYSFVAFPQPIPAEPPVFPVADLPRVAPDTLRQWQQAGEKHYNLGEYEQAVASFAEAAKAGYAPAQNWLGICCEYGRGTDQNLTKAVEWYRQAADQNNALAQDNLGNAYANGQGVAQDYGEAVKWYRRAAGQGNPSAQNNLGYCYQCGHGVAQDMNLAKYWYELSTKK